MPQKSPVFQSVFSYHNRLWCCHFFDHNRTHSPHRSPLKIHPQKPTPNPFHALSHHTFSIFCPTSHSFSLPFRFLPYFSPPLPYDVILSGANEVNAVETRRANCDAIWISNAKTLTIFQVYETPFGCETRRAMRSIGISKAYIPFRQISTDSAYNPD